MTIMTIIGLSAFLRVTEVRISGNSHYSYDSIVEASGITRGDGLMFMNTDRISQNIRRELPYISDANVTRSLPNAVNIEIFESTPVATIYFAGDLLLIDQTGRILDIYTGVSDSILELNGTKMIQIRGVEIESAVAGNQPRVSGLIAETAFQHMQDILIAMVNEGITDDVNFLDVSNIVNINFGYMNMYRVILGGIRDLRHKLGILPSTIARVHAEYPGTPVVISMTDPSGNVNFWPEP
jgi:hypothetical protein